MTAGFTISPLMTTWHMENLEGPPRVVLDFLSNMVTFNALVTGRLDVLGDASSILYSLVSTGYFPLAIIARLTRSNLLEVMGLDYIRTARAKGLGERVISSATPCATLCSPVTVIGLQLGGLLGGAVLTESVFGLPGVGNCWSILSLRGITLLCKVHPGHRSYFCVC